MNLPVTRPYLIENYSRPFLTIDCGDWTYGRPIIAAAPNDEKRLLRIGRYCSIGPEVRIYVGRQGRHPTETLSSYPLHMVVDPALMASTQRPPMELRKTGKPQKSLDVDIGHDVWIGGRTTILAGVTIGTGAVIGAGAVVTKDIPPYAVALGVPATVHRFRFDDATIAELLDGEWWRLEPDEIWRRVGDGWGLGTPAAVAQLLSKNASAEASSSPISSLKHDLSNAPAVLSKLDTETLTELFVRPDRGSPLPRWPDEETQRRFTAGAGKSLMDRAAAFVRVLEQEGAFVEGWRGLDYGCGWGRIASYMLTKGRPDQLDLCDAWRVSLDLIDKGGFNNRAFLVSDRVKPGEISPDAYDFIYAFSIFTHLPRDIFENNLRQLIAGVRPGGTVYFTVRHEPFLKHLGVDQQLDKDGFWFGGASPTYGDAVVSRSYLEKLTSPLGSLRHLSVPDPMQELYALTRP